MLETKSNSPVYIPIKDILEPILYMTMYGGRVMSPVRVQEYLIFDMSDTEGYGIVATSTTKR